jgi:hypothetical protein
VPARKDDPNIVRATRRSLVSLLVRRIFFLGLTPPLYTVGVVPID